MRGSAFRKGAVLMGVGFFILLLSPVVIPYRAVKHVLSGIFLVLLGIYFCLFGGKKAEEFLDLCMDKAYNKKMKEFKETQEMYEFFKKL